MKNILNNGVLVSKTEKANHKKEFKRKKKTKKKFNLGLGKTRTSNT